MGTDIHGIIERRVNGSWEPISDAYFPDNRNYDVFAILADVRNGRGFAGVKTSEGFNPIAEPRGLPAPYSDDSDHDFGDHSFSWLTLREVLEYDYSQVTYLAGVLTLEQFAKLEYQREHHNPKWDRAFPCPDGWSGDVWGADVMKLDETEARALLQSLKATHPEAFTPYGMPSSRFNEFAEMANGSVATKTRTYVRASWPRRYLDSMQWFLVELLPLIKYGLDDVRLVFGFDS